MDSSSISALNTEYVNCALCEQNEAELFYLIECDSHPFKLVKCPRCQLIYLNPRPIEKEIHKFYGTQFYGKHYNRFNKIVELIEGFFRIQRVHKVEGLVKKGRILDLGCGRGQMLNYLRNKGWETYGTEFSENAARHAKHFLGLNVFVGNLKEAKFPDNYFDIVSLWQVLEHLSNPLETLIEVHRILKTGGVLITAVPNIESFQSRFTREKWFHLQTPRHYYYFSTETLAKILRLSNFEVQRISHFSFELNPFGFGQSLLNRLGFEENFLYYLLKSKDAKGNSKSHMKIMIQTGFTILTLPIVAFFAIPCSYIESLLGHGGTIEIYSKKL